MKRNTLCLLVYIFSLALPVASIASDSAESLEITAGINNTAVEDADIAVTEKTNPEFYNQTEQPEAIRELTHPDCSSPQLYAKIRERILQYTAAINAKTTLTKRRKALILANLGDFSEVSVENFAPETNYNTANALIMIKINEKIPERDIILCRQNQPSGIPIYVVLYPYADNYIGYIINLDSNSLDYKDISFTYP